MSAGEPLPVGVRTRVIALGAAALGVLPDEDVPRPLRQFARFTPQRRQKAAAGALATALEADEAFRERVAGTVEDDPLAAAVRAGVVPSAADPEQVAALAYLFRPEGWSALVDRVRETGQAQARTAADEALRVEVDRLRQQAEVLKAEQREQARLSRAAQAAVAAEAEELRRKVRTQASALARAEQAAQRAAGEVVAERERSAAAQSRLDADLRRTRARLAEAERAAEAARRAGREGRATDDERLWVLLDTVVQAAQGLRRELALSPPDERPADDPAAGPLPAVVEDPAHLDRLLKMPHAHLVIDGYNVTKTGYAALPLESQRSRLIRRLGPLVAQTGAAVTVVFDGAERQPVGPAAPRGVRVQFSPPGRTADEVIRDLVAGEPPGRVVVVVSTDREVADGVRRSGAYAVTSAALLARLGQS